ncbi:MFS transporter [Rhodococcus opacus]|nr:MFS transporter [Rhodococcus opacus]
MIMPVTLAVITSTFPEGERSKGIGVWTAVGGGGGLLGMYLSALLVDIASWRWLFVLPVALVLVGMAMAVRSVPNSREHAEHRFDIVGAFTSVIAVLGLIFAIHEGPVHGWTEPATLFALVGGAFAFIGFVAWELRQAGPLLDLRLFRERGLAGGSVTLLAVFGVQAGIFVVLFPFLQAVLGWSALRATLALLPMALLMMLSSVLAARLVARIGIRATMVTGIFLGGTGLALMASLVSVDGGYLSVLPGMLAMGLGIGLAMTPSTEAITSSLPRERQGVASALNDVTREFGTALGVALLGAILSAGYKTSIGSRVDGVPTDLVDTARDGVANAVAAADSAGSEAQALVRAAQESFVDGWQNAMWVGSAVMAVLFIYVLARGPQRTTDATNRTEADSDDPAVIIG